MLKLNALSSFFNKGLARPFAQPFWVQFMPSLWVICCSLGVTAVYAKPAVTLDKTVLSSTVALSDNVADTDDDDTANTATATLNAENNNVETRNPSDISSVLPKDAESLSSSDVPLGAIAPATIQRFVKVVDTVRHNYVQPVNDDTLFTNAITGMVAQLDPYSEYLDSQAYNNLRLFTEGDMGSIGVKVQYDPISQHWVFSEVLPQSPAAKAGIQSGDYLHQINDNKLQNELTQQDMNQLLSGIAGTQLKLVVSAQGRRKHLVVVQRSLVQQQSIDAKVISGIAVVHIPIFQNNTQQQLIDALNATHQPFSALLLDLRNNPGGVLTAASDVASLFMQDKKLVEIHDRNGVKQVVTTQGKAELPLVPLAVLQNRYSASASEVLASSLQENGRARILGETSYGKGSIQSVIPISDKEAVKLTVAHYYSGQGKKIDGIGVLPDIPLTGNELTWENQAIVYLLRQARPTRYQLKNDKNIQEF